MAQEKLVLFDIDGTLILCGKAPRRAITEAMKTIYGTAGNVDRYPFSGKTDTQIIYDIITNAAIDEEIVKNRMQEALEKYVTTLQATLQPADIKVLTGIRDLLKQLHEQTKVTLGLLTGNVAEGARVKLTRAGLDSYFFNGKGSIGAFGSDSMNRNDLPAIAVERAYAHTGRLFKEKDIVIIGDSPYDVLCGKSLNVKSIAVATGWHKMNELQEHQPDYYFDDFSDTKKVVESILN
ncbi:HAD hydrolase-like protein [bacterium]|nr:MAG: HAD hydrolase-like protein [bacterium]